MKKVNNFRYENNGVVIIFNPCPENRDKYSFSIEGDPLLTEKILKCVKNKTVVEKYTGQCAKALFEIISEGVFPELTTDDQIKSLYEKFQNKFEEDPIFTIENLSVKNRPLFSALIKNTDVPITAHGKGRTKQEARANALKNLFEVVPT